MSPSELQAFLHEQIPLTRAMELKVESCGTDAVHLSAPIAPNINHRQTLFGGSASALAIMSAWSLVHLNLRASCDAMPRIVIQRNTMRWDKPIPGEVHARCAALDRDPWERLLTSLRRKGRGRITLHSILTTEGEAAAEFAGTFVAIAVEP